MQISTSFNKPEINAGAQGPQRTLQGALQGANPNAANRAGTEGRASAVSLSPEARGQQTGDEASTLGNLMERLKGLAGRQGGEGGAPAAGAAQGAGQPGQDDSNDQQLQQLAQQAIAAQQAQQGQGGAPGGGQDGGDAIQELQKTAGSLAEKGFKPKPETEKKVDQALGGKSPFKKAEGGNKAQAGKKKGSKGLGKVLDAGKNLFGGAGGKAGAGAAGAVGGAVKSLFGA